MPDLALRTTFIVGYPGETGEAFNTLLDFIRDIKFDRVGVFEFSFEPGTSSESLGDTVPLDVKLARKEKLMLAQQRISLEKNQSLVGETLDVLIEGQGDVEDSGEVLSLGRTYRDAPEIDGMVFIDGNDDLKAGDIVRAKITGHNAHDLWAEIVK